MLRESYTCLLHTGAVPRVSAEGQTLHRKRNHEGPGRSLTSAWGLTMLSMRVGRPSPGRTQRGISGESERSRQRFAPRPPLYHWPEALETLRCRVRWFEACGGMRHRREGQCKWCSEGSSMPQRVTGSCGGSVVGDDECVQVNLNPVDAASRERVRNPTSVTVRK